MFRPFVGEVISAKLKESDTNGLRCMLSNTFCLFVFFLSLSTLIYLFCSLGFVLLFLFLFIFLFNTTGYVFYAAIFLCV